MKYLLLIVILLTLTFSCNENAEINAEIIDEKIRSNWDQFIDHWQNEEASALAKMYHADGINIPPDFKENKGQQAIEEFYQFLFNNNLSSKYNHEIKDIQIAGDIIVERGAFSVNWTRNDSTKWTYYGRSIAHWQKDEKGAYKLKTFLFNNPPADNNQ